MLSTAGQLYEKPTIEKVCKVNDLDGHSRSWELLLVDRLYVTSY